jgi:5-methylcytosine-specific restriction endonuclease McrA
MFSPEKIWESAKKENIGYVEWIRRFNSKFLSPATPTRNPLDYKVSSSSYKRENDVDRNFRTQYLFQLLALYECRCAVCGSQENGFHLDHHWLPKSYGGNFVMTMKNDQIVCNAVPLCSTCNLRKSDSITFESKADAKIAYLNNIFTAKIAGLSPVPESGEKYRITEQDLPWVYRRCGSLYGDMKREEKLGGITGLLKYLNSVVGVFE